MSEEIKELDMDKYLVLKWDDIGKYLTLSQKEELHEIIKTITIGRALFKIKPQNQYLVLNLDDEISIRYLFQKMALINEKTRFNQKWKELKVKDIAVALINSILKSKNNNIKIHTDEERR